MNARILLATALIMFSGSGGLSDGFERAGFETTGLDFDPRACEDHRRLIGRPAHCVDIRAMGPADLRALHPECPDVLASSSPCVGFSGCLPEVTSKTEKYQDFNDLALHGIQIGLEAWKGAKTGRKVPGLIVFENVPRIMTRGKKLLEYMVALLHAEGYAVEMSTHDCGELGKGLAQRRRRFLLVARHMATVTDFLRKPPAYKPLALRDILWELPPPRPGGKGMHTLPVLSALNHLRLAAIFAGKDWRVLPSEVYLYTCESSELEAVTGIRWEHCAGRHAGKLGVLDWTLPARTIIGKARVCNTWNAVADPRVGWSTDGPYKDRPSSYGVVDSAEPSPTVRGKQLLANSAAAVDDPRVGVDLPLRAMRQNGGFGVETGEEPGHAVVAEGTVRNTRASVADPRLTCAQRSDAYGVQSGEEPSSTIVGNHGHDNVRGSVADPRLDYSPRRGSMGVQAAAAPSDTIRGNHSARQAPGSVQDPRVGRKVKLAKHAVLEVRYDERGWPIATHELVILADGRYVLYGPAVDFKDKRPRADIVIRAPDGCLHRPLTDAELSRIMGFPLGFEFCGPSSCAKTKPGEAPRTGRRKRIGNAVPPPTAYAIAQEMMATLVASSVGGFRLASGLVWVAPEAEMMAAVQDG
mgnify:CR=1 FL=1